MKEKRHQSIRIFENPLLERLTHVHPIVPLVIWGPVVLGLLLHSYFVLALGVSRISALVIAGLVTWTFSEYILHRFVFHMPTCTSFTKRLQFIIHGLHHDDPHDPTRLVMPPAAAVILAFILYSFFRAFLGAANVEPFFAAFIAGYLCYDYTHFFVHHRVPKTLVGKKIRSYHLKHHYATPEARWGVSSPLWDFVFGTLGPAEAEGKVQTAAVRRKAVPAQSRVETSSGNDSCSSLNP